MPNEVSTAEAGDLLGVSAQTVRKWCESGRLAARRVGIRNAWRVDRQSVDELSHSRQARQNTLPAGVRAELSFLREAVEALQERTDPTSVVVAAVERERDRYRAENAALREAALRVNAAARETQGAVRQLLAILEEQSLALEQLLAPASPLDILP